MKLCSSIARYLLVGIVLVASLAVSLQVSTADTFRPVVRGRRGVVAGGHPLSVEAGMRILQHCGNAVDARVVTILAASVIEILPFSLHALVLMLYWLHTQSLAGRHCE